MAARGLALAALALLATGCGSRLYTDADVRRAIDPQVVTVVDGTHPFATWAAVTELELDPDPGFVVYAGENVDVARYPSSHAARNAGLPGVRRGNLVLTGDPAAVHRALARLAGDP